MNSSSSPILFNLVLLTLLMLLRLYISQTFLYRLLRLKCAVFHISFGKKKVFNLKLREHIFYCIFKTIKRRNGMPLIYFISLLNCACVSVWYEPETKANRFLSLRFLWVKFLCIGVKWKWNKWDYFTNYSVKDWLFLWIYRIKTNVTVVVVVVVFVLEVNVWWIQWWESWINSYDTTQSTYAYAMLRQKWIENDDFTDAWAFCRWTCVYWKWRIEEKTNQIKSRSVRKRCTPIVIRCIQTHAHTQREKLVV